MREHVDGVMTDDAYILQLRTLEAEQQASHTGAVHIDTEVVDAGIVLREPEQHITVAETDLEAAWRPPSVDCVEIERRVAVFDAVARPQLLERARLTAREAALAAHEAANLAMADVFRHGATVRILRRRLRRSATRRSRNACAECVRRETLRDRPRSPCASPMP